jgi:hypothetical protein
MRYYLVETYNDGSVVKLIMEDWQEALDWMKDCWENEFLVKLEITSSES